LVVGHGQAVSHEAVALGRLAGGASERQRVEGVRRVITPPPALRRGRALTKNRLGQQQALLGAGRRAATLEQGQRQRCEQQARAAPPGGGRSWAAVWVPLARWVALLQALGSAGANRPGDLARMYPSASSDETAEAAFPYYPGETFHN
jgi:hypothetical protein